MQTKTCSVARLEEHLKPRLAVEEDFARLGHSYRHSRLHRTYDHRLQRPVLRLALTLLGLYRKGRRNALSPIVRRVRLEFPDLPAAFNGFRLLQLSDFHIDGVSDLAETLARRLKGLECDLCVFTGDYRFEDHGSCDAIYPRMESIINSIQSRCGIYGILGNHDPAEVALKLQNMGVNMLVNDSAQIELEGESIFIVGVDDNFDYGTDDLPLALKDVPKDAFKILLAHAPELYESAAEQGVQLNLSGHTHGGQLRLPLIGALKRNARCPRGFAWGTWRYRGLQGFTSAGVGCSSLPIRYNCPPEIVLLELCRT